jgi:hypothetical protein
MELPSVAGAPISSSSNYPQHDVVRRILDDHLDGRYQLVHIEEAKSAQQEVYILRLCPPRDYNIYELPVTSSRRTTAGGLSTSGRVGGKKDQATDPSWLLRPHQEWADALYSGRNHLVVRIWKGGCRWWNLHRNSRPLELATAEVMGYRIASSAFSEGPSTDLVRGDTCLGQHDSNTRRRSRNAIIVPRLLHFEPGLPSDVTTATSTNESRPWAVFEYVGPKSRYFQSNHYNDQNGGYDDDGHYDDDHDHDIDYDLVVDSSYLDGMIKVRTEYGFEEPHPRWGRVPVDHALMYCQIVLHQVVIPLHNHTGRLWEGRKDCKSSGEGWVVTPPSQSPQVYSYSTMVQLYRDAWNDMTLSVSRQEETITTTELGGQTRIVKALNILEGALLVLESNCGIVSDDDTHLPATTMIPPLCPVLVHMDLQPQNIIFCRHVPRASCRDSDCDNHPTYQSTPPPPSTVFAVLDWEDAAWADPRFDLLLLCRKVCANRDQADVLWCEYSVAIEKDDNNMMENNSDFEKQLGPIVPWLQLETVHSIITLLLQSMDLLNGGRNPWETKNDLWGKLERQFARWDECDRNC